MENPLYLKIVECIRGFKAENYPEPENLNNEEGEN
jgi:hypothetical protein